MPRVTLVPTFFRETFGSRTLPREPEPDLVMDGPEQVASYAEAGRIDGVMSAAYLFHSAKISQVLHGCRKVLDLGCGPATQLAQVAALNPDIRFVGVDLSDEMLRDARRHLDELGIENVELAKGDVTDLGQFEPGSFDGIISTMALHHLPSDDHLRRCFARIRQLLAPGGRVYLVDFGRLKSLKSVIFFAYMNRKRQPHLFSLDYERSLRAAFLKEDFRRLAAEHLPSDVQVLSTFQIPILTVLKTREHSIPAPLREKLRRMRGLLPKEYRRELDDMRFFFWLGGMRADPFREGPADGGR